MEWCFNYHDTNHPYLCDARLYPKPDEQYRFVQAYIHHLPAATLGIHAESGDSQDSDWQGSGHAVRSRSNTAPKTTETERKIKELMHEARLWRVANAAQWIAWGIVQAQVPGLDGESADEEDEKGEEEVFDYLSYARSRALFFWGDCVRMGFVDAEKELPADVVREMSVVEY